MSDTGGLPVAGLEEFLVLLGLVDASLNVTWLKKDGTRELKTDPDAIRAFVKAVDGIATTAGLVEDMRRTRGNLNEQSPNLN